MQYIPEQIQNLFYNKLCNIKKCYTKPEIKRIFYIKMSVILKKCAILPSYLHSKWTPPPPWNKQLNGDNCFLCLVKKMLCNYTWHLNGLSSLSILYCFFFTHLIQNLYYSQVPAEDFLFMTRILYEAPSDHKWGEREIDYVLVVKKDVELNPNPNEVKECMYVSRSDLKGFLGYYIYLFHYFYHLVSKRLFHLWYYFINIFFYYFINIFFNVKI